MLVDDHAVVRAGFRLLLSTEEAIEVIAEADKGELALQLYDKHKPDVVIMDLSMSGIGGLETTRRLILRDEQVKVIVFSVHHEKVYISHAMNAGAKGYICKNTHPDFLLRAINRVMLGECYIDPNLINDSEKQDSNNYQTIVDSLPPREFEIFVLLAKGLTAHSISEKLCLSYKTIANYGTNIRSKFNVNSVAELTRIALALKIID